MKNYSLSAVVAVTENNAIGIKNKLPWEFGTQKDDMKRFVELTTGNTVIIGRKTFESFGSKPLVNRFHIILSNNPDFSIADEHKDVCIVLNSVQAVMSHLHTAGENSHKLNVFVIGGEEIYKQFMPFVDNIFLTKVLIKCGNADAFFPDMGGFKLTSTKTFPADNRNANSYVFSNFTRIDKSEASY